MGSLRWTNAEEAQRPSDISQRGVEAIAESDLVSDALALCQGFDGINVTLRDCNGDFYTGEKFISSFNWCRIQSLGNIGNSVALVKGYLEDVSSYVSSVDQGDPNMRLRQCPTVQRFCTGLNEQLALFYERIACIDVRKGIPVPGGGALVQPASFWQRSQRISEQRDSADTVSVTVSEPRTAASDENKADTSRIAEVPGSAGQERHWASGEYISLDRFDLLTEQWQHRMSVLVLIVESCRLLDGGPLLSAIHSFTITGWPLQQQVALALLQEAMKPTLNRITSWLVFGKLDRNNVGFFIQQQEGVAEADYWEQAFILDVDSVPDPVIPLELALVVLRAGKSLNFLLRLCKDRQVAAMARDAQRQLEEEAGDSGGAQGEGEGRREGRDAVELVERLAERVSDAVEMHLVQVIRDKYQLLKHCELLKRYILLCQGNYAKVLMEEAASELSRPVALVSPTVLAGALHTAVRQSEPTAAEAALLDSLRVQLAPDNEAAVTGWDVFSVAYHLPPPLSGLISSHAQRNYQRLFFFLWRLRRAHRDLSSCWSALRFSSSVLTRFSLRPAATRTSDPASYPSPVARRSSLLPAGGGARAPRNPVLGAARSAKLATPEKAKRGGRRREWGPPVAPAAAEDGAVEGRSEEEEGLRRAVEAVQALLVRARGFLNMLETHCMLMIEEQWGEFVRHAQRARNLDELIACHHLYQEEVLLQALLREDCEAVHSALDSVLSACTAFRGHASSLQACTDSMLGRLHLQQHQARSGFGYGMDIDMSSRDNLHVVSSLQGLARKVKELRADVDHGMRECVRHLEEAGIEPLKDLCGSLSLWAS